LELIHKVLPLRTCTRNLPPEAPPSEPCLRYHVKRCPAPCKGGLSASASEEYRQAIEDACAFLGGERTDLIDRLKREMFEAAARQDYERAARLRDALRDADQVLLGQRLVTGAVEANNLLIVYPSSEAGAVELYLVRHGRLAGQQRTPHAVESIDVAARELARVAAGLGAPPPCVGREEVDQINIVARWISHHSEDSERCFFTLPHALDRSDAISAFAANVAAIVCSPAPDVADAMTDADDEGDEVESDEVADADPTSGDEW
ncbi:MAG TPA: UvrB/UvrC motif-containing protein, partial [Ktedonobacterales bacterium]|nr:UvrB/UvrC motif-containing protein [Ktedonobacterales bacterium]